jgi:hypothetical protein
MPIFVYQASGNDTIDRYPPACREIERILCVKEVIFRKLQKDFRKFLKVNKTAKEKPIKKPKIKPKRKISVPEGHFEPSNFYDTSKHCYNQRISRMKDWHNNYGQGMYE